ncbi:MAG TPA: hypothetical protein VGX91_07655 [Candidatus Cybelea sp.]|nr:hypothetical protein [Candidatus Cybelea sp.]
MPRSCSICSHSEASAITKALGSQNGSLRTIASRFGVSHTALSRHRVNCMGIPPRTRTPAAPVERVAPAATFRFESLEPKVLIAGAARLVDEALELLENAKRADDQRTALRALREARDGLALLMRVAGMLTTDGAATILNDNRQLHVALDARSLDELLAMRSGLEELPAIEGERC